MIKRTTLIAFGLGLMSSLAGQSAAAATLADDVQSLYDSKLKDLFIHFHENPELSFKEDKTAARLGDELEALGYTVHRGIGGTGLIAMLENGPGPTVMFRADMDGLPVQEKSGLPYASEAKQLDWDGNEVYVMHACGHDVHITSLVGTAKLMVERKTVVRHAHVTGAARGRARRRRAGDDGRWSWDRGEARFCLGLPRDQCAPDGTAVSTRDSATQVPTPLIF